MPPRTPKQRSAAAPPDLTREAALGPPVCGIDEAGRGPWAGPVAAAAVIWPAGAVPPVGITDSKKLSAAARDRLFDAILAGAQVGIGEASVEEIDRLNILRATMLAMARAVAALPVVPGHALVDGNRLPPDLPCPATALVKGDSLSLSIAAASIIAKVHRDRIMAAADLRFPGYGFARHMGYGTPEHHEALQRLGPTSFHRTSFSPIKALIQNDY
ncbi:ribonuclease HII [Zavarzinia compransoris]|uniref:Ribonuclease HII n=1 Tax=Zavarzinia compransoris TaxID=1264899 RepID=A0A317EE92_9PROT|nr:ribonuclease HII [Zavarzinia compransoris]PWR23535.1 ribonuclease HII [Zavarzinia compransoris]TDP47745.1 RNase HII [Zavarzinia compransoris]